MITDSAYDDASRVIVQQSSRVSRVPSWCFALVPRLFPIIVRATPRRVSTVMATGRRVPALHIRGAGDTAIDARNLDAVAAATGGQRWLVPDAEHVRAHEVAEDCRDRVLGFLDKALAPADS